MSLNKCSIFLKPDRKLCLVASGCISDKVFLSTGILNLDKVAASQISSG
ncbi:hypothetical protein QW060_08230 [Myroides ceti]|uniref:Uncharacterized protein n=1 Tax=Paenimyroides ceti TaxID=395087 RepID=A0ABT8CTN2_9FLAO|nr:hypothetical protein [Paenimyroides ceti]MDN3707121.1 hypothetical protein [Paenimyroides ceti]